jgi:pimeloyl-ACP methyl ester carboxylesterase
MTISTTTTGLAYEVLGSGPTLIMVHGGLVDRRSWTHQVALASDLRLVLPDTRNFGDSRGSSEGITIDDLADDVLAVADDAGCESFHLLGFSIGGIIAQTVALRAPDRVRSLVLVSTRAGGFSPPPAQRGHDEVRAHVHRAYSDEFIAANGAFLEDYIAMASENEARGWDEIRSTVSGAADLDATAKISCPTLVMHARADRAIPFQLGEQLAAAIPGARLVAVEGSGHTMQVERPDEFNRLVLDFVRTQEDHET